MGRIITEHDITSHLMVTRAGSPPLDILVRTSGVKRLSDFMLWQASPKFLIFPTFYFVIPSSPCLLAYFNHFTPLISVRRIWGIPFVLVH